jgi:AbrB family looped-hinge helix DNA binding protein
VPRSGGNRTRRRRLQRGLGDELFVGHPRRQSYTRDLKVEPILLEENAVPIVKTSVKGQVVIPAEIRARIGLKPGGKVMVTLMGADAALIHPLAADPIGAAFGMLSKNPSLLAALKEERRKDDARQEKKLAGLLGVDRVSKWRAVGRRRSGSAPGRRRGR